MTIKTRLELLERRAGFGVLIPSAVVHFTDGSTVQVVGFGAIADYIDRNDVFSVEGGEVGALLSALTIDGGGLADE